MLLPLEIVLHLVDLSVLALRALLYLITLHALVELVNGLAQLLVLTVFLAELPSDLVQFPDFGFELGMLKLDF